ncbi:MAG: diaminopimelate decarboxylase family protein, partial [Acidimicrobiales bacterium]
MSALPRQLLPDTAEVGPEGQLLVGGCDVAALAEEFGTPLFVYDESHLRVRCREAREAFGEGVAYATKAFLCTAMAQLAHEEGLYLDVATGGEVHVALAAGVPARHLVLHGNNKSDSELRQALDAGVWRIVVDSFDELDRIEAIHAETTQVAPIWLRLTPGVEAHTHEFVATGQDDSKFGFTVSTGLAARAIERANASLAVELHGLHAHIGSQVFAIDSFRRSAAILAGIINPTGLAELSVGGGLGVPYVAGEEAPSISQ